MYQFSLWILLWSILYYFKIVSYPPLKCIVLMCFMFSFYLFLTDIKKIYILFTFIIHGIPLLLINYKKIKITKKIVNINLLIILLYWMFMSYNDLDVKEYYSNMIDNYSKNNSNLYKFLFSTFNKNN